MILPLPPPGKLEAAGSLVQEASAISSNPPSVAAAPFLPTSASRLPLCSPVRIECSRTNPL
ncbi:hypothetical protein BDY24DRAFT_382036 [Mrakia frigida]|uniref:uncharacterized protein n=1 Tax=Mrakia frigida TaxID=29902 RepID=UPI003FCC17D9